MNIDWSKAPEGATHYRKGNSLSFFRDVEKSGFYFWNEHQPQWRWVEGDFPVDAKPINTAPTWSGEGLPPVGTKCEWLDESSSKRWLPVEIVFASYWVLVARDENPHPDGSVDISFDLVKESPKFRPIRTHEQIRDEAVRRMANAIKDCPTDLDRAAVLYMQGYRKTEG
ncbi:MULTISPECIES: hypothetical protein [Pseudomonas]|uniref:hypothetical protein n=1 Tax=Pseudomonas TaxID=286 RepID=UPI002591FAF4|nr:MULTISPECIES: hypothetical protein [Pseudomonas]